MAPRLMTISGVAAEVEEEADEAAAALLSPRLTMISGVAALRFVADPRSIVSSGVAAEAFDDEAELEDGAPVVPLAAPPKLITISAATLL